MCTYEVHDHYLVYICYCILILSEYFPGSESWIVTPLSIYIIFLLCVMDQICKFRLSSWYWDGRLTQIEWRGYILALCLRTLQGVLKWGSYLCIHCSYPIAVNKVHSRVNLLTFDCKTNWNDMIAWIDHMSRLYSHLS